MLNLFAFRATKPGDMKSATDAIGPENDACIAQVVQQCGCVVAAWGSHGTHLDRWWHVKKLLRSIFVPLHHLGLTSGGQPKHPLYLKADTERIEW